MEYRPSFSDSEFWVAFRQFNALFDACRWQQSKAQKEHIDELGDKISEGDIYFNRQNGSAYGLKLKLSRKSMDQILNLLFSDNDFGVAVCNSLLQENKDRIYNLLHKNAGKPEVDEP